MQNRVTRCPECGGDLGQYAKSVISEGGYAYRKRQCYRCHAVIYAKQPPEEITGVEHGHALANHLKVLQKN